MEGPSIGSTKPYVLWLRIGLAVGAVSIAAALWLTGLPDLGVDPGAPVQWGSGALWLEALLWIAVFAILGAIGVPPALLVFPTGSAWPARVGLPIALLGGLGAATLGFLLSRYLARDFLETRIPRRLRHFEERIEANALLSVVVLRLLFYLFPPVNWMLGISHIPLGVFIAGTVIGFLPGTIVFTLSGRGLLPWALEQPPGVLAGVVSGLAALVGVVFIAQKALHARLVRKHRESAARIAEENSNS